MTNLPVHKRFIKRGFDLLVSGLGLIFLSPLIIVISLLVLISHGRPILFRQVRPGANGKPFEILKFRTMIYKTDKNGQLLPDSERLTRVGKFLRAFSLDELPEFINVLRGEMSIVGPRPLLMQYLDRYTKEQARRHEVLPGITGWAQINGRNTLTWEDKFRLDVWYIDNWSFGLDLKIIFLTVWKAIKREGINQPGQATAGEFMGSQNRQSE